MLYVKTNGLEWIAHLCSASSTADVHQRVLVPSIFNRRARNSDQSAHHAQTDLNSLPAYFPTIHLFTERRISMFIILVFIKKERYHSVSRSLNQQLYIKKLLDTYKLSLRFQTLYKTYLRKHTEMIRVHHDAKRLYISYFLFTFIFNIYFFCSKLLMT